MRPKKLDAAKREYSKLTKEAKQKARDRDENPAPQNQKKAKDPKDKTDNLAPDVITDAAALDAAKKACNDAAKKVEEAKLVVAMDGAKLFKQYTNLFSDKAHKPWEKILKAQVTQAPWEDVVSVTHTKTPTKDWLSFQECVNSISKPCFILMSVRRSSIIS